MTGDRCQLYKSHANYSQIEEILIFNLLNKMFWLVEANLGSHNEFNINYTAFETFILYSLNLDSHLLDSYEYSLLGR